ncbi:MAG: hypothetical protein ACT4N8_16295 [Sphingosinicella sp.]|uniref:hypothetical protein n=1 Tax=Sphingosinicella sp. TaxID=1917971 RepID=UPI004037C28C
MKWLTILLSALLLAAQAPAPSPDPLDAIARDYVRLQLEIDARDEGYVDAYYGPAEWREAARANPRELPALAEAVSALQGRLAAVTVPEGSMEARRIAFLNAQLTAAATRLRTVRGERLSFAEEAQGLYGVTPELRPLSDYDPLLARVEALVPGEGPLPERIEAFTARFTIPADRLDAVMRAAIAECRRRTVAHIPMPEGEAFTLEFVTNQPWSGYNWYQGNYRSLIQINTDQPVRLGRAVDLGCHEGYPGHHAYNALLERELARGRGWIEYMVYPLYSPQSFIAEGSANYGIELAFPGEERLRFETETLYPLAGLSTEGAAEYLALQEALEELSGARFTIARDLLEGRISEDEAVALARRYQLMTESRARQSIAFTRRYRSYVINYGLGEDWVRSYVESMPNRHWETMREILSGPTLPGDLVIP